MSTEFWNARYADSDLVYGEAPNEFLVAMAPRLPVSGAAVDIGAGEGRNALFLASLGLDVLAVDQSDVGLRKASTLAQQRGLKLRTQAADLSDFTCVPGSVSLVSSIFVHLPSALRKTVHTRVIDWLQPGGMLVLEAYSPEQLARDTGGPKDPQMLASLDTLLAELAGLEFLHSQALVRRVVEGKFHGGDAAVVQILARKR